MKDTLVTTLPIKPYENLKVGISLGPLVSEMVAKVIDADNCFSFNLLNTYEDKKHLLEKYKSLLINYGINTTNKDFIDTNYKDDLLECISKLISQEKIVVRKEKIIRCDCGKVDICRQGIKKYENGVLYKKVDNKYICMECGSECKEYIENGLYLHLNKDTTDYVNIRPKFLNNAMHSFEKQFRDAYYLVSKKRNTECNIYVNHEKYNIDVDSLWMNYINIFDYDNQVIVASNHQLFEMYLINYINNMFQNKNLYFIATPYLTNPKSIDVESIFDNLDYIRKKLILLYTMKWKNLNSQFDNSIIKKISKLSDNQVLKIYEELTCKSNYDNIEEAIDDFVINRINFQKTMRKV